MRKTTVWAIVIVCLLSVALGGTVWGRPSYAIFNGNSCSAGCHEENMLTGKMQVSETGLLVDLGTQLDGKVRGPRKTFRVKAGDTVTLSVDVLDGNDKFAAQLKRLEKGGQLNDAANKLLWSESTAWTRQESGNPAYFTRDNGADGGLAGALTPATYTFDLLVHAGTPLDVYDLEFAAGGTASGLAGLGRWYQDEHFYVEVVCPFDIAGDINRDCKVDFRDVSLMSGNWLVDCLADSTDPRCGGGTVDVPVVRGGLMYDKWWAVAGVAAPTTNHPLWASRPDTASNSRSGADTWRCKECHGWDYKGVDGVYGGGSHKTGIAGIFGTAKTTQEVFDMLKIGHAYGTVLGDEDIGHLATFATEGLIDTDGIIDIGGAFTGSVATGQTLFNSGIGTNIACVACHGSLGLDPPPGFPAFADYVGLIANANPWEFQHKMRFGQPATAMPSAIIGGGTLVDVADIGAYSQTLPEAPADTASVVRGGLMYDKWWAVAALAAPTTDHPLWASRPDTASNARTGADTWRCKECHGWDYKGVDGVYGGGSHRTGIAGIFGTAKTAQEVFDLLKIGHAYGTVLIDADIEQLAAFVTEGQIDTDSIIDTGGAFTGSAATGQTLYNSGIGTNIGCVVCHGSLGLDPPPGFPAFVDYVGLIANANPWEFQHKMRFGQPATAMPSAITGGGTLVDVEDIGTYSQTLPQAP